MFRNILFFQKKNVYLWRVNTYNFSVMVDFKKFSAILSCLDEYMVTKGKKEIDDMEANRELERVGLLKDSQPSPGSPLRDLLMKMRDSNLLPQNIRQTYGIWTIKLSKTMAKFPQVNQFQYC